MAYSHLKSTETYQTPGPSSMVPAASNAKTPWADGWDSDSSRQGLLLQGLTDWAAWVNFAVEG